MVSKLWLNLLLWGLGDRLEKKNDYKTDILMVLNIMTWYSLFFFSALFSSFPGFWLISSLIELPSTWLGTQLGVGYIMVKKAGQPGRKQETAPEQAAPVSASGGTESEEP